MAPDGRSLVAWRAGERNHAVLAARGTRAGRFDRPETVARTREWSTALTAALSARGDALLAWTGSTGVMTAEAAGRAGFGTPQLIERIRRPFDARPLLGPDGAAIVTWDIPRIGIATKERPGAGQPFAAARTVGDASVFNWSQALGAGGRTLLAWNGGKPFTLMARQWTIGGELGPVATLSTPQRWAREPYAVATPDGFAVAWSESDGRTYRVRVAVAGPDGRFAPAQFASEPSETARSPKMAVDARGNLVVAWMSGPPRQGFPRPRGRIRAAVAPRPGAAFGRPVEITPAGQANNDLQIASSGGDTHLMWIRGRYSAPKRVMVVSRPSGGRFGRPRRLSPPGIEVLGAAIAAGSGERAVVAWTSEPFHRLVENPPDRVWVARRLP